MEADGSRLPLRLWYPVLPILGVLPVSAPEAAATPLWQGYNEELMLDMIVLPINGDTEVVHCLVLLTIPGTDVTEASIDVTTSKDRLLSDIESGAFQEMVNNCYINTQVATYKDYIVQARHVH